MGDKPEMANVVKLSGNFLIASVIESLGEAIALTRKYGIDPHDYVEFLTNSLFAAPVYKTYGGIIAEEKYKPAGFKLRLGLKDVRLALAAAESVDTPLPFASLIARPHADRDRPRHGGHGLEFDGQAGGGKCRPEVTAQIGSPARLLQCCSISTEAVLTRTTIPSTRRNGWR